MRNGVLLAALAMLVAALPSLLPRESPTGGLGELTFQVLHDQRLVPTSFSGSPLLVQFWSTACVVCLKEMPELGRLYRQFQPRGLRMVAVATPADPPNRVWEFQSRLQPPFPLALDPERTIYQAFGRPLGTPTFFLLDAQGRIVARHAGGLQDGYLLRRINNLLAQKT